MISCSLAPVFTFQLVPDDRRLYTINVLAATTGMRLGECRGLQKECVHENWIEIKYNWQDREGLKAPKWGSSRAIPAPVKTIKLLNELSESNPWGNDFIFYGNSKDKPIGKKVIEEYYKEALSKIEISG